MPARSNGLPRRKPRCLAECAEQADRGEDAELGEHRKHDCHAEQVQAPQFTKASTASAAAPIPSGNASAAASTG